MNRALALLAAALLGGCGLITPATSAAVSLKRKDGSEVVAEYSRAWTDGKSRWSVKADPEKGELTASVSSVDDVAEAASAAKERDAQVGAALLGLGNIGRAVLELAASRPVK